MSQDHIRVLHVATPARFGGLETVVRDLSIGLHARGHQVEVLSVLDEGMQPAGHPFLEALTTQGVPVSQLSLARRAYLSECRAIRGAVESSGASVVHSHGYRADVLTALTLGSSNSAIVSTAHGFTGGGLKNRIFQRLQVAAWRRFDAVVAVSAPLAQTLESRRVGRARIHLISNAWRDSSQSLPCLEARHELGIGHDVRAVGWVGRLSPEKGPDVALEAFGRLRESGLELHFVGSGRMSEELHERVREQGLEEHVVLHGPAANAGRLLAAFDLLVISSRTEGTPMILFEAMAAGVPIVATRVGGIPDVISEREAMLVPSENTGEMANAIRQLLDDNERSQRLAENASRRLRSAFAFEPWLDAYESLYRGLMARATVAQAVAK